MRTTELRSAGQPRRLSLRVLAMPATFYRRRLPHLQRDGKPHFVTFCTYQRWVLPEAARNTVLASCTHDDGVTIALQVVVVMPDHVHSIFTPLGNAEELEVYSLGRIMDAIKGASAHRVNRELGRTGRVWQTESFDRVLRRSEKLEEKVAYILDNPVRAGLVPRWQDYPWLWHRPFDNPFAPDM